VYDPDNADASGDYIFTVGGSGILSIDSISGSGPNFEVVYQIYFPDGSFFGGSSPLSAGSSYLVSVGGPGDYVRVVASGADAGSVTGTITAVVGGNGQGGDGGDGGKATANGTNSRANGGDGGDAGLASASGGAAGTGAATGGGSSSSNGAAGNNT